MTLTGARAVLLDLDGTLVDSAPDLGEAVDRTLSELGLPGAGVELARRWVGNGSRMLVMRALTNSFGREPEPELLDRALERFFVHYADCLTDRTAPYPGVPETLHALRDRGLCLAVVTNKPAPFTEPLLAALDLDRYFEVVVSGDTLPVKKPDPAPLQHAASTCGVPPEDCVMVGDSMADLEAARNAAMPAVCVSYGYHGDGGIFDARPDAVVDSLSELPALLDETSTAIHGSGHRE